MQAPLALLAFAASGGAWLMGAGAAWLIAAIRGKTLAAKRKVLVVVAGTTGESPTLSDDEKLYKTALERPATVSRDDAGPRVVELAGGFAPILEIAAMAHAAAACRLSFFLAP